MKKFRYKLILVTALSALLFPALAEAKGWETVKTERAQGQHVATDGEIEIKTGGGVIYIVTSKNINVKIFTILGSRIAEDNLSAGTYQFAVPTHGVYIIKAGDLTCKVAV